MLLGGFAGNIAADIHLVHGSLIQKAEACGSMEIMKNVKLKN